MTQYDEPTFFDKYAQMPRSQVGLSAAGEWPQMKRLLGDLAGLDVLDLGCGYGWHCRYAAEQGAKRVLGVDASRAMLARAEAMNDSPRVRFVLAALEAFVPEAASFDAAISNLALHYVADLDAVYRKVYDALRPGGRFVMNIEHPTFTAGVNQTFVLDEQGRALYWPVDGYFAEGARATDFLGKRVVKQHHTMTTIVSGLLRAGFTLEALEEVRPTDEAIAANGWENELKRPMMLLLRAAKR